MSHVLERQVMQKHENQYTQVAVKGALLPKHKSFFTTPANKPLLYLLSR